MGLHGQQVQEAWPLQERGWAAGSLQGASVAWFPLPLLWPSSALPHPLQAKEAPSFPHFPRCQVEKVGLIFRFSYYELTLPYIKNSSHYPGRLLHSWERCLHPASGLGLLASTLPPRSFPVSPFPKTGDSDSLQGRPDLQSPPASGMPAQCLASSSGP